MQTITSQTKQDADFKHIVSLNNGNEDILKIDDMRITNLEIAKARARAELLQNGYFIERVEFETFYRANLKLNDQISIKSDKFDIPMDSTKLLFVVKKITTTLKRGENQATTLISKIEAERYNSINATTTQTAN